MRKRGLFSSKLSTEDPKFARAYANLAATHRQDSYGRWSPDPESSKNLAYVAVQKGVELAENEPEPKPSLPSALEQLGWLALYNREYEKAAWAAEEVVRRNHNSADGYILWAQVLVYKGQPQQALEKLEEAIKHNPKFPYSYDYHPRPGLLRMGRPDRTPRGARNILRRPRKTFGRLSAKTTITGRPARTSWLSSVSLIGRLRQKLR